MKIRLVKEPKGNNEFLYSTEAQYDGSSAWVYVSGTCSRNLAEAETHFERVRVDGVPSGFTVLREGEVAQ